MARYAYVNGRYVDHREASVHVEDRGYQLADGVYEVVGVRDGKLIDEDAAHRPAGPLAEASCASPGRWRGRRWASSCAS